MALRAANFFSCLNFLKWKLKYVCFIGIASIAAWSFHTEASLDILLGLNLCAALMIFYVRFKYLPKAKRFKNLCLLSSLKADRPAVAALLPVMGDETQEAMKTMQGLRAMDYPKLDVVVLFCGNEDSAYRELKAFCKKNNRRFRLKRGEEGIGRGEALNSCLEFAKRKADFIMCLPEGFVPAPHILAQAITEMEAKHADFIQYSGMSNSNDPESRLEEKEAVDFFQTFMRAAPDSGSCAFLAPLGIIKTSALERVGGWDNFSPSPEIRTSLCMVRAGLKGFYKHSVGGVLPNGSLKKENRVLCSLLDFSLSDFFALGWRRTVPLLLQLTSRWDFLAIPLFYYALSSLELFFTADLVPNPAGANALAGTTIVISLYLKMSLMHQKLMSTHTWNDIVFAYFLSLGKRFTRPGSRYLSVLPSMILAALASFSSLTLYRLTENVAVFAPALAFILIAAGAFVVRSRSSKPIEEKGSDLNDKGVWRIEVNSSKA